MTADPAPDQGIPAGCDLGVMITIVTHGGLTIAKTVPTARWGAVIRQGVGLSPVSDAFGADGGIDAAQSLARPDGDERLVPDPGALRRLGGMTGWAWAPADRRNQDGTCVDLDQRGFARRQVDRLATLGVTTRAGFELEWFAGHRATDNSFIPLARGGPYSAQRLVDAGTYSSDLLSAFATSGIEVQQLHAEYSPGQFEVSLPADDPVTAADLMVLAKLIVTAVTRAHGAEASFSPALTPGGVGNGGHVHVSFARDGRPLLGGGGLVGDLTDEGAAIVAGLVAATPSLLAVGCPLSASYLRLQPSRWAGVHRVWGIENREAPIRLITAGGDAQAANLEWKNPDPAANPYLVIGSLLAVAADSIEHPTAPPAPVVGDPAQGQPHDRLPTTLADAVAAFRSDPVLRSAMGGRLHDTIAEQRAAEVRRTAGLTADQVAASTRWWPAP